MGKKSKSSGRKSAPIAQETAIEPVRREVAILTQASIDVFIQQFSSDHIMLPLDQGKTQKVIAFLNAHNIGMVFKRVKLLDIACMHLLFSAIDSSFTLYIL